MTTNQSSIFILEGLVDYEGGQAIGAYSTKEAAVAALDAYKAAVDTYDNDPLKRTSYKTGFDGYSIVEFILDAAADWSLKGTLL